MTSAENKAVFLSYASQDAEPARRIAETLRAAGIEVWFDQNELVGGDAWDAKIRKQIAECALFVPIISAATQARLEGYFRIEWKLAARRTHGMATAKAFLLPVVIDATHDTEAHVPDEFREVQWTRLPGGDGAAVEKFGARAAKLLGGKAPVASSDVGARLVRAHEDGRGPATPLRKASRPWLVPAMLGVAAIAALAFWQPWKKSAPSGVVSQPLAQSPEATGAALEIGRIRSKLRPDEWTRADFNAFVPVVDRLIQTYPENADAWALRSISHSLLVIRNIDSGTKPLEAGKAAIDTALRIAPDAPLAQLGLGLHLVAMISRGGDIRASRTHIDRGVAGLPAESLTRFAELVSYWLGYQIEGADVSARKWLAAEPQASFPAWILAQSFAARRQPAEAVKWAELAASDPDITGTRSLVTLFESHYYVSADLAAARAAIDRVPAVQRGVHRVVASRFWLAMAERHFDQALQELARVPESMLFDRVYHGPKSLLAGFAHQAAGRADVAQAQFRDAERMLRDELTHDAENQELRTVLALNLALLGRADEARRELAAIEPLLGGQEPNVYSGQLIALIAQTHGLLGEKEALVQWLRRIFTKISPLPFTPASLRLDTRFAGFVDYPEIQELLKEFAPLDQKKVNPSSLAPDAKSVAVLAFANLSADKDNEYFSDGIADELLTTLQKIPGLRVSAHTSAWSFKGKNATAQEIGETLHVANIVEGNVQKSGNRVKITARLSRAATNVEVWSESFGPLELTDVFATQSEIAQKIVAGLRGQLTGESTTTPTLVAATAQAEIKAQVQAATKGGTKNPEAHQLYLQGRFLATRSDSADVARGIAYYEQALKLDQDFTFAWAALARARLWQLAWEPLNPERAQQARIAATRALALDANLADAHSVLSQIQLRYAYEWRAAREASARALALAPTDAAVITDAAATEQALGSLARSIELAQRAVALDPVSVDTRFYLAMSYQFMDRLADAENETRRMIELSSNGIFSHAMLSCLLMMQGRAQDALAEAQLEPEKMYRLQSLSAAHYALGQLSESDAALQTMIRDLKEVGPYPIAWVYAVRKDRDKAFEWLERSYELRDSGISWVRADNVFRPLHADPRWPVFLKKIGLSDEQLK